MNFKKYNNLLYELNIFNRLINVKCVCMNKEDDIKITNVITCRFIVNLHTKILSITPYRNKISFLVLCWFNYGICSYIFSNINDQQWHIIYGILHIFVFKKSLHNNETFDTWLVSLLFFVFEEPKIANCYRFK